MRSGRAAALGVGGRGRAWDRGAPRQRIRDVALSRPRVGPSRARVTLEREGWQVGKQRVNIRDALEGLQRCERIAPGSGNVVPAVDANPRRDTGFVHDQMLDGRRVPHRDRDRSVESRERDPGVRRSAVGTMRRQALDKAARRRGLTVGDGTGPACAALDDRFWRGGVKPDCARPRKPIDNGPIESLNVRLRDEFVNVDEAGAMPDLRDNLGAGQDDDSHRRPHGSLGRWTPGGRAATPARLPLGSGRPLAQNFPANGKTPPARRIGRPHAVPVPVPVIDGNERRQRPPFARR